MRKTEVVDLFCGAGGLTYGLSKSGLIVRAGIDIDPYCLYPYKQNNKTAEYIQKNIKDVAASDVTPFFSKNSIKVLAGCAPCQPFSTYTNKIKTKCDKWGLLYEFTRLVKEIDPEIVTMENVPQIRKHGIYNEFKSSLENLGYYVESNIVYCPDYGIPQTRKRLILLASKLGEIHLINKTHNTSDYKTVFDTIVHLPAIKAGQKCSTDPLHTSSKLSSINLKRIRHSKPGGTWRDWPEHLIALCHTKKSGKSYPGVYGRMEWDKPSPTVTTQCYGFGNGRFGHPEQNRGLSLREAALLQTFPQDYKFVEESKEVPMRAIGRLIGNAVPVRLGEIIGLSIKKHLEDRVKRVEGKGR